MTYDYQCVVNAAMILEANAGIHHPASHQQRSTTIDLIDFHLKKLIKVIKYFYIITCQYNVFIDNEVNLYIMP